MKPDRRSQLIENYEDAIFALAMNDLMIDEGEHWEEENERLKSDSSFKLPEKMNQRCMRAIERTISRRERRRTGSAVWKVTTRIAVAFMAVFIAFSFSFMTVSAVREPVLEFFIVNFGNGAFVRSEPSTVDTSIKIGPKWVPTGDWKLDIIADEVDMHVIRYDYNNGRYIEYREQLADEELGIIDTENVEFSKQIINNRDVLIGKKEETTSIYWINNRNGIDWYCDMCIYGFDDDIVLRILTSCD